MAGRRAQWEFSRPVRVLLSSASLKQKPFLLSIVTFAGSQYSPGSRTNSRCDKKHYVAELPSHAPFFYLRFHRITGSIVYLIRELESFSIARPKNDKYDAIAVRMILL